jgi:hypothetical protein
MMDSINYLPVSPPDHKRPATHTPAGRSDLPGGVVSSLNPLIFFLFFDEISQFLSPVKSLDTEKGQAYL